MNQIENNLSSYGWEAYELLDSGNRMKLERFGPYLLSRFEREADWKPALEEAEWKNADAEFSFEKGYQKGKWEFQHSIPHEWIVDIDNIQAVLSISTSRHIGIFPEQFPNWLWIKDKIKNISRKPKVLNIFAYTGIATAFAASAGADVTHVDASKSAINWAKKNILTSGLVHKPVRWIVDDAEKFVKREIRRKNLYDGIIMDPPKFGRGPNGETWKFEKDISNLIALCVQLLSPDPLLFICTAYNVDINHHDILKMIQPFPLFNSGQAEFGDLIQVEKSAGRNIPQAIYVRWSKIH